MRANCNCQKQINEYLDQAVFHLLASVAEWDDIKKQIQERKCYNAIILAKHSINHTPEFNPKVTT